MAANVVPVPPAARLPLLVVGMLCLVAGVFAGLARHAIAVPDVAAGAAGLHGALMIAAFFGTVIGLERAVALGAAHWYLAPAASGLGGLAVLAGQPAAGALSCLAGSAVFVAGSVQVVRTLPALFTATLAAGAVALMAGNALWLVRGHALPAVPLWLGFLVLTIAGERLELTRMLPPRPAARRVFVALLAALVVAIVPAVVGDDARPFAAVLLGIALWLLRHDIARRNLGQRGLPRFVAVCLLSGYVMLAAGGALGAAGAFAPGHAWRDAALHAVLLGFVFAMVIGHAPIVFPAVMRVRIPYHAVFYLPLVVLQASLLLRIGGGLAGVVEWQRIGAIGNAVALAVLIATLLARVAAGRRDVR